MKQIVEARIANLRSAPRCGAKNRRGGACQSPAVRGRKRCRLHGGWSTGAPRGVGNGHYKDGTFTIEAEEERRWLRELRNLCAKAEGKA